jgi:hypothetical protein
VVEGNYIGTDELGFGALGNSAGVYINGAGGNTIGGTTPGARNVISSNQYEVYIYGTGPGGGNTLENNYLGTDRDGTASLAQPGSEGVVLDSTSSNHVGVAGAAPVGNIIVGHAHGVLIEDGATDNTVATNNIGTDVTGTRALGNTYGVAILGTGTNSNVIGGNVSAVHGAAPTYGAGFANTIAFSSVAGVYVDQGTGNSIRFNTLIANGPAGIDLTATGNKDELAPVLTARGGKGPVSASLHSQPSKSGTIFIIDFYATVQPGEGQTWLKAVEVATDSNGYLASSPDSSATITNPHTANASFTVNNLPVPPSGEPHIIATATDGLGNTSEFSNDL